MNDELFNKINNNKMMKKIYFKQKKCGSSVLSFLRRHAFATVYGCLAGLLAMSVTSCVDDPFGQTPTDSVPPAPLENVQIEKYPGGGRITYSLPKEKDISYVKGEYFSNGTKHVLRASVYKNFLLVEGLGSTDPVDVTLYVVDHSENHSVPVTKTVIPDTPPLETIYETLELSPDFGGINVRWYNALGMEVGVTLFVEDSLGVYQESKTTFSSQKNGNYTFTKYDTIKQKFAIRLFDKWSNTSALKEVELVPLFEKQLDRLLHKGYVLPYDNTTRFSSATDFPQLFDGTKTTYNNFLHTAEGDPSITMPFYITIDLGMDAMLSRMMFWHRVQRNWEYSLHNVKEFELWAVRELKTGIDTYWQEDWKKDWEYMGKFLCNKPSEDEGAIGQITSADLEYARKGFDFRMPNVGKVRYLRFAFISTWGGTNAVSIQELEFFGQD
jgi:hypothetical protein